MIRCPECGHSSADEAAACPNCGHALANGTAPRTTKPPPPPELSGVVFEKMTPEIEALLGPYTEEDFWADVREIEHNGGVQFEDIIREIGKVKPRD